MCILGDPLIVSQLLLLLLLLLLYCTVLYCTVLYCVFALQAQGLCQLMGGREALVCAIQQHGTVLAAHGPYTAAGASDVLGLPVPVVSKHFSTFHGLVAALSEAL
jgi:hypothetical protein